MTESKEKKTVKSSKPATPVVVEKKAQKPMVKKVAQGTKNPSNMALFTGRRKNAVARVALKPGSGNMLVNKLSVEKYFPRDTHKQTVLKPFAVTKTLGQFDLFATVKGGGHTGQAGAILLGIARALDKIDASFRPLLKEHGLLTRDARVVERKKYGKHKARRSKQFSKR